MTPSDQDRNYVPVDKALLIADNTAINFNIFLCQSAVGKKPILLAGKDTLVSHLKEKLANAQYGSLCIEKNSIDIFNIFLEQSISSILDDKKIPAEEKAKLIYESATNVVTDMFNNPEVPQNLSRTRSITENIIKFISHEKSAVQHLLQLSSHDYYTFTHCVNVAVIGTALWKVDGKGQEDELMDFALGCILHDIGKTRIGTNILKKPGPLTPAEFDEIKTHPEKGYHLMKDKVSDISLDIILHHHEKQDGKGYPKGLKGSELSNNAKISTIADVYDALTTKRAYADAEKPFNALVEMKAKMTGHFEEEKILEFIAMLGGQPAK